MMGYYAIKDNLAERFLTPFICHNDNEAKRMFMTTVNDHDNMPIINENPQDYELYKIGTWDDNLGIMEKDFKKLADATAVKREA